MEHAVCCYQDRATYFLETDYAHREALMAHLKRYKLRARLTIDDVTEEYAVVQRDGPTLGSEEPGGGIAIKDVRGPYMGYRHLIPLAKAGPPTSAAAADDVSEEEYLLRRLLQGIAETHDETFNALPHDISADQTHLRIHFFFYKKECLF